MKKFILGVVAALAMFAGTARASDCYYPSYSYSQPFYYSYSYYQGEYRGSRYWPSGYYRYDGYGWYRQGYGGYYHGEYVPNYVSYPCPQTTLVVPGAFQLVPAQQLQQPAQQLTPDELLKLKLLLEQFKVQPAPTK